MHRVLYQGPAVTSQPASIHLPLRDPGLTLRTYKGELVFGGSEELFFSHSQDETTNKRPTNDSTVVVRLHKLNYEGPPNSEELIVHNQVLGLIVALIVKRAANPLSGAVSKVFGNYAQ